MKSVVWLGVAVLSLCGLKSFGSQNLRNPELVDIELRKTFIPLGFDSNDQSQIVVSGSFSNTCYQVGPHSISIDHDLQQIQVTQQAYLYEGFCLQVTVPFFEVIDLGILNVGGYTIVDGFSGSRLGVIGIAKAPTSGPGTDDFPYAPVNDAYVVQDTQMPGAAKLILKGTFTNRCMRMKEVNVAYYSDVLVVLPIVEMIDGERDRDCVAEMVRFQQEIPLKHLDDHAYLIHVRTMSGKALNRIFDGFAN